MKKIIVANWKLNPLTVREARELLAPVKRATLRLRNVETVICPPAVFLPLLNYKRLGAQDCSIYDEGAYTGEISAKMLRYLGIGFVILGHSERRALGESDETINRKIKMALSAGLKVILCVGEHERDHNGEYLRVIREQLIGALGGLSRRSLDNLIVAYEPLWAIGEKAVRADTPYDFLEQAIFIRKIASGIFGDKAKKIPVLYGGSVDHKNAAGFISDGGANGLLVGRVSLRADQFIAILKLADKLKE